MKTARTARDYYNACKDYDKLTAEDGYYVPERVAKAFMRYWTAGDVNVLDVGCGTGQVGKALRKLGFKGRLMGLDIAEERLAEARATGAYDLTRVADAYRLPWDFSPYDGVVSAAMLGLAGPRALNEMFRVLRPGGRLTVAAGYLLDSKTTLRKYLAVQRRINVLGDLRRVAVLQAESLGRGYLNPEKQGEYYSLVVLRKLPCPDRN